MLYAIQSTQHSIHSSEPNHNIGDSKKLHVTGKVLKSECRWLRQGWLSGFPPVSPTTSLGYFNFNSLSLLVKYTSYFELGDPQKTHPTQLYRIYAGTSCSKTLVSLRGCRLQLGLWTVRSNDLQPRISAKRPRINHTILRIVWTTQSL